MPAKSDSVALDWVVGCLRIERKKRKALIQLALETSSREAALAICREDQLVDTQSIPPKQSTSQRLLPAIDGLLRKHHLNASQIELISVSIGPGSFTGLRVGVTTAKTLAYSINCPLTAVSSLEVIAYQLIWNDSLQPVGSWSNSQVAQICAVVDAARKQWFACLYQWKQESRLESAKGICIVDPAGFVESFQKPTLISGPGLSFFTPNSKNVAVADPSLWLPRAESVARLGRRQFEMKQLVDPFELVPSYIRPSAAEEKLRRRK